MIKIYIKFISNNNEVPMLLVIGLNKSQADNIINYKSLQQYSIKTSK